MEGSGPLRREPAPPSGDKPALARETPSQARRRDPTTGVSRRPRRFSRLSVRIMALSVFPVATIFGGLLYAGAYERSLIDAELENIGSQTRIFAASLGEIAVPQGSGDEQRIDADAATQLIDRLATETRARARLFGRDGRLIADSRTVNRPGGPIREEELPPPSTRRWLSDTVLSVYDWVFGLLSRSRDRTPLYRERRDESSADFAEVRSALAGEARGFIRRAETGHLLIFFAAPVQRYKKVHGALLLSATTADIEKAVRQARVDILRIITVVTILTMMLSFYLGRSIARPINRLAASAEAMRRARSRKATIPDFTAREDEIGDLSAALIALTNDLWRRLDAIESFAADVAHELKNPLASMRSAVETVGRLKDPEKQKRLLDMIMEDVGRLDRLITDISKASRLDTEMSRVVVEPVDVPRLLKTLAEMHETTREAGDPRIELAVPERQNLIARAVEDRLVQVFNNVIGNAESFSPRDGRIAISVVGASGFVEVRIDDQGPGIPPGKEEDIFKRFYSERPAGEKFGQHSGLGLSISKQIVEALGGTIHAENLAKPDGTVTGARFVIRVPRMG
jgi:two-component system sensor histidine kinase ChvG